MTHEAQNEAYMPGSRWGGRQCFRGGAPPPPGGEAPSNVDLVMSVRELIHPKPPKMLTR